MSVEIYAPCKIRHVRSSGIVDSFDKCLIELRQYEIGQYAIHGVNLHHRQSNIFSIQLIRRNQYKFSISSSNPDTIEGDNGTYEILLNADNRHLFHQVLRTCLEEFLIINSHQTNLSNSTSNENQSSRLLNQLVKLDEQPFYRNSDTFECITCVETIDVGNGILFYHCLHPLCKTCLLQLIETSTEPTVQCPHDGCTMFIEERELRGVVRDLKADEKLVDRLLDTSVRFVESRNKTVHCLTPDCPRWWFIGVEDANNLVYCVSCKHWICFSCTAIHEGQTCKEYQELKLTEAHSNNLRKDADHLEELIKKKEVMYCPGCRILIQKISGCDWIQCLQCKMEICWPTRGPRWGPGGRGDISGGCRCRADNGKLCVPNCGSCH